MLTKTITATSLLATLALTQATTGPIIAVPSAPIECQPLAVTFSGGTAPYFLSVIPGGLPSAAPLEFLPNQNAAGTYTWIVDIASGTSITIAIKDSTGAPNYTQQLTIQAGTSTECLGKSNPGGAAAAGSGAASAASSSATTPGATRSSNGTSSSTVVSASSSSATTSAPSTSSAASTGVIANGTAVVGGAASSLLSKVSSAAVGGSSSTSATASPKASTTNSGASTVQLSGVVSFLAAIFALAV